LNVSALLTVQNFLPGNKLQFASGFDSALLPTDGNLSNGNFSFSNGFTTGIEGGYFTITAIPEPPAIAAAIGLVGVLLWPRVCRALKIVSAETGSAPFVKARRQRLTSFLRHDGPPLFSESGIGNYAKHPSAWDSWLIVLVELGHAPRAVYTGVKSLKEAVV
jgi:hypothetical protein